MEQTNETQMVEEYISIPKKEYEHLKDIEEKYALKLKEEEYNQKWVDDTSRIQSIIASHIPNIGFNNGLF